MKQLTYNQNTKERLDKFLVLNLPNLTRAQIQKTIKEGLVLVNGQAAVPHHFLKNGEQITIKQESAESAKQKKVLVKEEKKEAKLINPKIIAETKDYLVIEKPSGLIVHSAPGIKEFTLADWLVKKYPAIKKVGDDPLRPGMVHRLDKEVSGVMVIAKTSAMFKHLKKQFKDRSITKEYLALVYGIIPRESGTIDFTIGRSKDTGKMAARAANQEGRESITEFTVLQRISRYTYLSINLKTGRTHQIRVHLTAYGYPLVGDNLYFNKKIKTNNKLDRIFLHAHKLGFFDLNNEWVEFVSPLPKKLEEFKNSL